MQLIRHTFRPVTLVIILVALAIAQIRLPEPVAITWVPVTPRLEVIYLPATSKAPTNAAHAAVLFENSTGTVLYGKNEHVTRAPASLTKIVTALVALEIGRLSDTVTVSQRAAALGGSSAHLFTGQKILLKDLMYAMLLRSGNDAAVAVAEHVAGSVSAFVELMNQRARELGASRTHFVNPHGLDKPGHFSTAFDLAMLSRVALYYPHFATMVRTQTYDYQERQTTWRNTNRLLWSYVGAEGIKTGTTGQAGNCLATAASRQGMQLIAVVLGSRNRWSDTTRLLDYGFDNFTKVTVAEQGMPLAQVHIRNSTQPVVLIPASDIAVLVSQKQVTDVSTKLILNQLKLPIRKGTQLGTYEVYTGTTRLKTIPLLAAARVDRATLWRVLWKWLTKR